MFTSISQEYLLFTVDSKGHLSSLKDKFNFVHACVVELDLNNIIEIKKDRLKINKDLKEEIYYLYPIYKIIKNHPNVDIDELTNYLIKNIKYFNELADSIKKHLVSTNRMGYLISKNALNKNEIYIVTKKEERLNIVEYIKCKINKKKPLVKKEVVFLDLVLSTSTLYKYFSVDEIEAIKHEMQVYINEFISYEL